MKKLKVSPNRRFLMTEDGQPFFWMGDTAWELFHRCTREQIHRYLENRRQKQFNVIQAVILAEEDGLRTPNVYGDLPLRDLDPSQPNEAYFEVVDYTIRTAKEMGLYIGLLPTWGDKVVNNMWGVGPVVFSPEKAEIFGNWLAKRYQDFNNIIWILGGDRPLVSRQGGDYRELWACMAKVIRDVRDDWLITYHPNGGRVQDSGAALVHTQDWSDLVMYQSGHGEKEAPTWEDAKFLYQLHPAKPFLDGEINYEDHPIAPWPAWKRENGYFRDHAVRKQLYRSVFSGACGVTYGHHHVWQMWDYHREVKNNGFELRPWYDALDRPAAHEVKHLVNLMRDHAYFNRIPDQQVILSDVGEAGKYLCATRDIEGTYTMVYLPDIEMTVKLDLRKMEKPYEVNLFDPRTGYTHPIEGQFSVDEFVFTSPVDGPDWVLLIEKA